MKDFFLTIYQCGRVYLQPTLQLPVRFWREIPRMPRLCKWRSPENPCHQKIRKSCQHCNQHFQPLTFNPEVKQQHEKSHVWLMYFAKHPSFIRYILYILCSLCEIAYIRRSVNISFCAAVKSRWCWELLCARLIWLGPHASCHNQQFLYICRS